MLPSGNCLLVVSPSSDGISLSGQTVRCDESSTTEESDAVRKVTYDECITIREQVKHKCADVCDFGAVHTHTYSLIQDWRYIFSVW